MNSTQDIKPEIKNEQSQNTENPQVKGQEESPDIKTDQNKANWKAFREQRESDRKAREAADKIAAEKAIEVSALRAALEAAVNKPTNSVSFGSKLVDGDIEESEQQRIDKRVREIIKEREDKAEQERQLKEKQEYPQRLARTYSDFHKTIQSENLDYLDYHYPEVSKPLSYMPEGYDKWAAIYQAIKKFVPNIDGKKEMAKAEKNLQKPQSISSTGTTQGQTGMPNARLSEQRKADNWERMQRTLNGLSN